MKRALLLLAALGMLSVFSGCKLLHPFGHLHGSCLSAPENCNDCGVRGCGLCKLGRCRLHGRGGEPAFNPGPQSATVTYPYYTTRGPRDYLARSPRPIGP
jgi:hypothetical protein